MNAKTTAPVSGVNGRAMPASKPQPARRLPKTWRDRLPNPSVYYGKRVERLGKPNAFGWVQGRCPFHEDREASLSVNVTSAKGGWLCFAGCGKGDLVSFHMRATGLPFRDAVADLLGVR